ncbi:MAG TPA: hypothetical protein PLE74_04285 [Candidatus Cloacimonadota bacterium]|nr:hypothetical protein [Candidatus Cloacimonadota bacterium]HPT71478.1 hypothetical protein [Candidatus Cloacimonadota bacterium]
MAQRTDKYFIIDWIVHLVLGMILPVIYMVEYQQTNQTYMMSLCVFCLTIPFEGYYLLLSKDITDIEKICVKSTYFNIIVNAAAFGISGYILITFVPIDFRFYLCMSYIIAIGITYKNKLNFHKELDIAEGSNIS